MKLNLGCGNCMMKDYVNVDNFSPKCDVKHDLNKFPYPFKANSVEEVYMCHVLEHLDDTMKVMAELRRILKKGGVAHIRVPHFSSNGAFTDPTHKRFFGINSFDYFDPSTKLGEGLNHEVGSTFRIEKKLINFLPSKLIWNYPMQWLVNAHPFIQKMYELTGIRNIFPAAEVEVILVKE